jgi:Stigma-specific protein, Stig1
MGFTSDSDLSGARRVLIACAAMADLALPAERTLSQAGGTCPPPRREGMRMDPERFDRIAKSVGRGNRRGLLGGLLGSALLAGGLAGWAPGEEVAARESVLDGRLGGRHGPNRRGRDRDRSHGDKKDKKQDRKKKQDRDGGRLGSGDPCQSPKTRCGQGRNQTCVDTQTDPRNCGACGNACSTGEVCENGVCTRTCGNACGTGEVCENGGCFQDCSACPGTCGGCHCSQSTDSSTSTCHDWNFGIGPCLSNADCPSGSVCDRNLDSGDRQARLCTRPCGNVCGSFAPDIPNVCDNGGCFQACGGRGSGFPACPSTCGNCQCSTTTESFTHTCHDWDTGVGTCQSTADCPSGSVCDPRIGSGSAHLCTRPCPC